ncbi:Dynein heavy chain 5, axonemal [Symbiodinium microadriaticum]|uniref:Dynein heavy chain 5, axonemal n=1 Tax=Symbiodinium microadriaticum TaxID=2951 RepID=A0A1Q9E9Z2_SYMMI|nr:Dynein heavy chain 5, axonemal [Symbiodinium microadriaticum]
MSRSAKAMQLVLFDEAMQHLMKINRTIQQKRGSAMLVGVGGSGKQSLARITITKTYNDNALFEDLKALCIRAGVKGPPVAVIRWTFHVMLSNGTQQYDFEKKDAMCGDVRNDFVKENPNMEVNAKFPIRAQKFPAVFTVNINWFMPWPEAALVAVSSAFLSTYKWYWSEPLNDIAFQAIKYEEINVQERSVNVGLQKLKEACA